MKYIPRALLSAIFTSLLVFLPSSNLLAAAPEIHIASGVIDHKGRTWPNGCHLDKKTHKKHCH